MFIHMMGAAGSSSGTLVNPAILSGTEPRLIFIETDQGADGKYWDLDVNGGVFSLRTRTDLDGAGNSIIQVTRSGLVPTALVLNEDSADMDVRIESNGNANHYYSDASQLNGQGSHNFGTTAASDVYFLINPGAFTASVDTSVYRVSIGGSSAITIPATTAPEVVSLRVVEPNITLSGGTVTLAATLYIHSAATEAVTNFAIYQVSGLNGFRGNTQFSDTATAQTFNSRTRVGIYHDANIAASTRGQLEIHGATDPLKCMAVGYDTTNDRGYLQAVILGTHNRPLRISETIDVGGIGAGAGNENVHPVTDNRVLMGTSSLRYASVAFIDWVAAASSVLTINEAGADADFRIETDTNPNTFCIDAGFYGGIGAIGIGSVVSGDSYLMFNPVAVTATANTNFFKFNLNNTAAVTVPSGTTAEVGMFRVTEPNITATGTVTLAYTASFVSAPTEATTNFCIYQVSGRNGIRGQTQFADQATLVTMSSLTRAQMCSDITAVGDHGQLTVGGLTDTNKGVTIGYDTTGLMGFMYARQVGTGSSPMNFQNGTLYVTGSSTGNVGIGTNTYGTSAARVLAMFLGTVPSTSPADTVQLYAQDISAGNCSLGLRTEIAVAAEVILASTHILQVTINGTMYKILLSNV